MSFIRSGDCVSCGLVDEDNLYASVQDVQRYAGQSALHAVESLDVYFCFRSSWIVNGLNDAVFTERKIT